jgi:drug/metabolite transporter (DMT)-like permease
LSFSVLQKGKYAGRLLFPVFFILVSLAFYTVSFQIKGRLGDAVGPAIVPMLWLVGIIILSIFIIIRTLLGHEKEDPGWGRKGLVLAYLAATIFYLYAIIFVGYYIATFLYLGIGIYSLSYQKLESNINVVCRMDSFFLRGILQDFICSASRGKLIEWIFG